MRFFLTIAVLLALTGCRPDITCEDVGCAFGEACNDITGVCEAIVRDCRVDDICRAGEVCDESSGECRSEALQCADGNPCPNGLICDAQSGFCKPAFRCTVEGCSTGEVCDTQTERCTPKPCLEDAECPDSFVCQDSACTAGCRPGAQSCPPGQSCLFQTGDDIGQCEDRCRQDTDCPFGQICVETADGTLCQLEAPCQTDSACRPDEVCRNGTCTQPPCATDSECLSGQICQVSTGTCVDGTCDEDIYGDRATSEPNHSFDTAFPLAPGDDCPATNPPRCLYSDLVLCSGRSDWFAVNVQSSNVVQVRVEQNLPKPDIDIYIYDADRQLIAFNEQLDPVSIVRFAAERSQTILVEIRSEDFETASYNLTISNTFCINDTFEENDSLADATTLPGAPDVESEITLRSCGQDTDWLKIPDTHAANGIQIELFANTPDMNVQVYLPDGSIEAVPTEVPLDIIRLGVDGDVFVRAQSNLGLAGEYTLRYEVDSLWTCPEAAGANSTSATAFSAPPGIPTTAWLCPLEAGWETDWWALQVDAAGVLTVIVDPSEGAPDLEIALLEAAGADTPTVVRSATATAGSLRLDAAVDPLKNYWIRVTTPTALGRISGAPAYSFAYDVSL